MNLTLISDHQEYQICYGTFIISNDHNCHLFEVLSIITIYLTSCWHAWKLLWTRYKFHLKDIQHTEQITFIIQQFQLLEMVRATTRKVSWKPRGGCLLTISMTTSFSSFPFFSGAVRYIASAVFEIESGIIWCFCSVGLLVGNRGIIDRKSTSLGLEIYLIWGPTLQHPSLADFWLHLAVRCKYPAST